MITSLLGLVAFFVSVPPLATIASPAFDLTARVEPDSDFKAKLQKLGTQNARSDMAKLVKSSEAQAVAWIVRTGEQMLEAPTPELETFFTDLQAAWKTAFETEFADRAREYYTGLDAGKKRDRVELMDMFEKRFTEFRGNLTKKDGWVYMNLADELDIIANGFDSIGDQYMSSEAWILFAQCYDEPLRGDAKNLHLAWQGYTNATDTRAKWSLVDARYDAALKRKTSLAARGADKPDAGTKPEPEEAAADKPDATKQEPTTQEPSKVEPTKPTVAPSGPVTVPLAFDVIESPDEFQRPNYNCDDLFLMWRSLNFQAKGSSASFESFKEAPPVTRVGSSDLRFDLDGNGEPDEKIPLTGGFAPVKITVGKGAEARPWAFLAVQGNKDEQYQGMQLNQEPTDKSMTVYVLGAASVTGVVNGVPVRVIDENMDGIYGTPPLTWGFIGLTAGHFQADMDSIVIGSSKRARPWSPLTEIHGNWYQLEVAPSGKELKATPVTAQTGTLKLDFKGLTPTYLVVHGTSSENNNYFDLVEGGSKGVAVPVGTYQLFYGEVRKGKKSQLQKVTIVRSNDTPTWEVNPGKTTLVTLGAPFGFAFKHTLEGETLRVEGQSVVVTGSAKERYERPWNCTARPEVAWRKKGTKKGSKPERMPFMIASEDIDTKGWPAAWFPFDLELQLIGAPGAVEVQLTQKKHDLFGKIESDWKE